MGSHANIHIVWQYIGSSHISGWHTYANQPTDRAAAVAAVACRAFSFICRKTVVWKLPLIAYFLGVVEHSFYIHANCSFVYLCKSLSTMIALLGCPLHLIRSRRKIYDAIKRWSIYQKKTIDFIIKRRIHQLVKFNWVII